MADVPVDSLVDAARAIGGARRVLFSTGAGLSAEAGYPTYHEPGGAPSRPEPWASLGVNPSSFLTMSAFRDEPERAWGSIEHLRRLSSRAELHEGFHAITRWVRDVVPEGFVITANIDGLHRRAGVPSALLWERYGSIWDQQCAAGCARERWTDERVPLCDLDEATMRASRMPTCPLCGALARPRVQMKEDSTFLDDNIAAARWEKLRAAGFDVIVVIGSMAWFSWPDEVKNKPRVVSINLDPAMHAHYDNPIALTMGARAALTIIDGLLRAKA